MISIVKHSLRRYKKNFVWHILRLSAGADAKQARPAGKPSQKSGESKPADTKKAGGSPPQMKGSYKMKISARNQIKGTVKSIREGAVNAVVVICRGNHNPIKADITMESVKELGLEEGKECYAIIKATNVMFATSKISGISARNQIEGTVVAVTEGAANGHVTIEDADGCRISGSITNESIEDLGLVEGKTAVAIIKATDVMVAVD